MHNNWKKEKLRDIAEVIMGQSPKSEFYNDSGEGLPFFQGRSEFGSLYPVVQKWCTKPTKIAKANDVLMTVRAPVGDLNITKAECIIGRGVCALRSKANNDRFLFYLLKANNSYITSFGSGAIYDAINKDLVEELTFLLPNEVLQRKISSVLSAFDDLIENNDRRIQIFEEMCQRIYREWFVDFRFFGHEEVKFVDSDIGKIPVGWKVVKLSDIVETQYGYTESTSNEEIGPKFLRGMDINKNSFIDWNNVPYCKITDDALKRYQLAKGDIVIIRMADPGKVGIVERNDINAVFASYLIRLKIKEGINPYYLFYFLLSDEYQGYITGASTGATRKSASAGVITDVDFLVPNKKVLNEFVEIVSSYRDLLNNLIWKNEKLKLSRDILLPRLISGEIDVSELDIELKEEVNVA